MLKNVLIVDDSSIMRKLLIRMLRENSFPINPIEAADGKSALSKFDVFNTHLVLCDWSMPNMDGLALVRELRLRDHQSHVPIVMFTAEAHGEKVLEALTAGANDYVRKPFTVQVVREKLARYF